MLPYLFLECCKLKRFSLEDQLIKFEVLIGMILQFSHWSMVFCSILQSMVRSELFHPWGAS